MKNFKSFLFVLLVSLLSVSFSAKETDYVIEASVKTLFCQGFEDGYKEGVCDGKYGCIPPVSPVCPVPTVHERYDNYKHGYLRGYKRGLADK